jgi:nucleotide-binding universal stress UspA family protein
MFTKILLPADGSPWALAAAEFARDLLRLDPSARLTILHVRQLPKPAFRVYRWREVEIPAGEEMKRAVCEAEERILAQTEKIFADAGLAVDNEIVSGSPAEEICAYAEKGGYDLIVMGVHSGGKSDTFINSPSHQVLQTAKSPVVLVKA